MNKPTVIIPVKSKGLDYNVLIDNDDAEKVSKYNWWLKNNHYVYTIVVVGEKRTSLYLHRLLINASIDTEVDHINRNPLDNRKGNLRLATRSQNNMNKSGIRGVSKFRDKWRARIKKDKKEFHVGIFNTKKEAIEARQKAELVMFKDFANV